MFSPIKTLQQLWQEAPAEAEELVMLGDVIEVVWGNTTLIGVVTYGDPWLDDLGRTWMEVTGVVSGSGFATKAYITDNEVIRIIARA